MKQLIANIKQLLKTGGISDAEYIEILSDIERTNKQMIIAFSMVAMILLGILSLLARFQLLTDIPLYVHLAGLIALIFALIFALLSKFKSIFIHIALYITEISFLAYGFYIGVFTRPDQQATAFMVFIVLLPLIFADKPIKTILISDISIIAFIIAVILLKNKDVKPIDITDALIFGLFANITCLISMRTKLNEFLMEEKLHIMSTKDQLTGLNNRNCYEWMIQTYPNMCKSSLSCIYIDVNGLHELNNTQGHKAGDDMLSYIAQVTQKYFGMQNAYRIGGDEYVAFLIDAKPSEVHDKVTQLKKDVEFKNYHVAVGTDRQNLDILDMKQLIKNAETKMYTNKEEYYKSIGKEHR